PMDGGRYFCAWTKNPLTDPRRSAMLSVRRSDGRRHRPDGQKEPLQMKTEAPASERRRLCEIAREIRRDWRPVNYAALPYLNAMAALDSVTDTYGYDTGQSVVLYFLANAGTWRGETARRIKAELKSLVAFRIK